MTATTVKDLHARTKDFLSQKIQVNGWVRTVRPSRTFGFIELNDGTFFSSLQVVYDENLTNFLEVSRLVSGSAIKVAGVLVESPGTKQPFELKAESIAVEGLSAADYPLQKKRHTFEYLRTIAHLRPRTNTFSAVFRIRSAAGLCHSQILSGKRLCPCAYAHHHRQRRRRRRTNVPGDHPGL